MSAGDVFDFILDYTFYYPLFMSFMWMIGASYYFFYREHSENHRFDDPPEIDNPPPVTFIVPCHNEGDNAIETIGSLLEQDYPDFEIIAVNDASTDNTGEILDSLAAQHEQLRVIHFASNQGKAMGLRMAAVAAQHEILVCLDGDALLDRRATKWMVRHFVEHPRVAAVTGNPRVRNRTTLLGKIQTGEFSSIIGIIKRAQRIYGRLFTVSGVVAAFRKSALHMVDYWSIDKITEDIDISWRLQLKHFDIRYEPNALCWILMPETLSGLWRQRLRWAQGGVEVLVQYFGALCSWRSRRLWVVALELLASTFWAYCMLLVATIWLISQFTALPWPWAAATIPPGWTGVLLGSTCLMQFAISLTIDSRYEPDLGRIYYWMIWYPLVYWMIQAATSVLAVPQALLKPSGKRATWVSPDRGVRPGAGT